MIACVFVFARVGVWVCVVSVRVLVLVCLQTFETEERTKRERRENVSVIVWERQSRRRQRGTKLERGGETKQMGRKTKHLEPTN